MRPELRAKIERFIPTCVGNTSFTRMGWAGRSVHPHVRGEYGVVPVVVPVVVGSSPRAWGIHQNKLIEQQAERFIPTCVGNTG